MAPAVVIDPLLDVERGGPHTFGYAMLEYNAQPLLNSYDDLFQINALSAFVFSRVRQEASVVEAFGLSAAYATYLMNGKVQPGDSPGSRLQWMMNAFQVEYGFFLAFRIAGLDLLLEYSRTSQHPLRDPYSEVSSDLLKTGLNRRFDLPLDLALAAAVRLGYSDIFDFWQSPIPKPRARYLITPSLWLERPLTSFRLGASRATLAAAAEGYVDFASLRGSGWGLNSAFRTGVALVVGALRFDLYLDGFASDDTEIRDDRTTPVGLLGWGLRIQNVRPLAVP
jgi:hypothetical protein